MVLLAVFTAGGLLAPMLHNLEHGLAWRFAQDVSGWTCDHADHGDALERARANALDDDCLTCTRHEPPASESPTVSPVQTPAVDHVPAPERLASRSAIGLLNIRGPPSLS